MFTYALFIPNSAYRAAGIIGGMAAAPIVIVSILWATNTACEHWLAENRTFFVEMTLLMGITALVAVVGVHTIGTLRAQAFEAKQLGQYRLRELIGAGGMGEVYLAEDSQLDYKVALKFLSVHLSQDETSRARFTREAKAAAKLDHPNIVPVHELGEFQGRPFFAMTYIEGQSLREVIKQGKLTVSGAIDLCMQICEGLNEAHTAGVVHRDIKPGNIIIDTKNKPRILDFGLATVSGEEKLTKTGSTLGTVGYMSPEQITGKDVDHRSDIFSIGVILYEMLTSRRPFEGDNDAAVVKAITDATPEPVSRFKSGVSGELQQVVDKALSKDPSLRYQHADGMLSDLKRLKAEPVPTPPRKIVLWVATAVVALAAGYFIYDQYIRTDPVAEKGWDNSIAVLPLRDFSSSQDQEYFSDGMTDAIIGKLSGIKNLKVISMTSVMRYKNTDRDLKKIGHDLQVNTILEGSIQLEGDRLRVRVQLINVADDAHLWSQTYNRQLESIFDIQDDISRAIVDAMRVELVSGDTIAIARRYTQNIEAYSFYMRGRHLWAKRTEGDIRKAIEYYQKAIELDSYYALAYSGLADAWSVLPGYLDVAGTVTQTEATVKAKEAAEIAIGLDEGLAEAHASLGLIFRYESNLKEAEREFWRAIELNPGYFWAHFWYSQLLQDMARYPDQIREEDIAFELNPMSITLIANRALRKRQSYEWQEAEELYQRLIEIEPNRTLSYITYANFLAKGMDRNEDAIRQCSLAVQIDKQAYNDFAYIYEWIGDFDKAIWAANMYLESTPDKHNAYDTRGEIYALNGMLDSAVASFKKALELKPDFVSSLWQLGNVYMFRQEYAKAESLYQVVASHPDKYTRADGRLYLTQIPLHQGKLRKGLRMLAELKDKAIAESVKDWHLAYGNFKRGYIYLGLLNDQKSAIAEHEKVIGIMKDINPNSWMVSFARGNIANSYAQSGDMRRADELMAELKRDIDRYGPLAISNYQISTVTLEMEKGNYDNAAVQFQKAFKSTPLFFLRELLGRSYL
ncbi:MAG: protein kinase, partial [candidate division Zixibacteria bacterium]|nr:protein kinase [candidate division Zixibacteria bacterium]